ncbi:MAG TPA: DUF1275 domain-containing protein [Candidatus Ornithomonoglobus intestinigallinarum]|uniref:DUF1275 domain-containing protein n=1 Tax=Candidatus Ornithomonoglobus intestinigallinarum TaxID=2840894 RepID=A0A9D1H338_9FIRM|nr:DUF1275 domain-containing protein [Candidatus Ornithomonoglobus intestinigallinarum]
MAEQIRFIKKAYSRAQKKVYPAHEQFRVCMALAFIGGFLEAYTYILKGNIFANAQTGNFALMALNLAYFKEPLQALYYLIPISAYVIGILLTVEMPRRFKGRISWYTLFMIIQFCVFAAVGFLPESVPHSVTTVSVAFLCAMQYNTFKSCRGVTMSTVFCTNNLRQFAISAAQRRHGDKNAVIRRGILYLANIFFFVFGAASGGALISVLQAHGLAGEYSIWLCCLILIPAGLYTHFHKPEYNNII